MVRNLLCLFTFLALTQAAGATPPRYASVGDTPFGVSQTHIFLLRTLSDNEGSHYITSSKRFLVAQALVSGKTEHIWHLDSAREDIVEEDAPKFEYHRAAPIVDPLEILAEFSAAPLILSMATDWSDDRVRLSSRFVLSDLGITDYGYDTQTVLIPAEEIQRGIAASLNPFLDSLPDDPGPVDPITFDGNAYTKNLADCFVLKMWGNVLAYDLFRLECENGEFEVLSYQIYLTIPSTE